MEIRLSEVVAALSHALDITHGQPRGHATRSCLIGMRIAAALGLDADARSSLFYALLLKDAGCSTNASKIVALYGSDDAAVKRDSKLVDIGRPLPLLSHMWRTAAPDAGLAARARRMYHFARNAPRESVEIFALRCERGADIARMLDLGEDTARAIRDLDEHWDASGKPLGLAGEEISPQGRILCLAQTMEVFWQLGGPDAALTVARRRRGTWFDPALVDTLAVLERDSRFWAALAEARVTAVEPADRVLVADDARLDRIAEAFARVVDAKTPHTARHSIGVAEIAAGLGDLAGRDATEVRTLWRAGLLHDLGKLAISNVILDKPGRLTPDEWDVVRRHPELSERILRTVPAFADLAEICGSHHERLDGSGYARGRAADELDEPSRILAVADVAEALGADRPYRAALDTDEVLAIMRQDAGTKLDADVFVALEEYLPRYRAIPAGLDAAVVGA
jgi:HD-GYP domain-containing protein (c-di-GMP phosphodiesterase class II)